MAKQPKTKEAALNKLLAELADWGLELEINRKTCEIGGMRYRENSSITKLLSEAPPGTTLTRVLFVPD
jgi:hypothetical protein